MRTQFGKDRNAAYLMELTDELVELLAGAITANEIFVPDDLGSILSLSNIPAEVKRCMAQAAVLAYFSFQAGREFECDQQEQADQLPQPKPLLNP